MESIHWYVEFPRVSVFDLGISKAGNGCYTILQKFQGKGESLEIPGFFFRRAYPQPPHEN